MNDTLKALQLLEASALESIDNGAPVTLAEGQMVVNDMIAQGDIGVIMLAAVPRGLKPSPAPAGGQVAPGNTMGSRHTITDPGVTFYETTGDVLSTYVVESTEGFTLRHPEHANITFPKGVYRLTHQQNEQHQRVLD